MLRHRQIQRRRREKRLAREALDEALTIFEDLGTPGWADRARAELARIPRRRGTAGLTPTEETIARLAGEGPHQPGDRGSRVRQPEAVEANLTRIYRKLGVRSRAVLASRFAADRERHQP